MKRVALFFSIAMAFAACEKEDDSKLTPACDGSHPTYNATIKAIIDVRCGIANCHSNYTSYNGLSEIIQNGSFKREVLINQSMPQGSSLTQTQINTIQCWVNDGYPEN